MIDQLLKTFWNNNLFVINCILFFICQKRQIPCQSFKIKGQWKKTRKYS